MSDESLSGPLPISGHRKPPFDVPGQPKLEFPFIRIGYWEKERRKNKAQAADEMPQRQSATGGKSARATKIQESFI
jgi:hypothetical protein